MKFSYVFVAAIAFFFLFYYLLYSSYTKLRTQKYKAPPEAGGAWPFIGHLHLMKGGSTGPPHVNLGALADQHGPVFTIRLGVHRALVVSSWELAKELFTRLDVAVFSRPSLKAYKNLSDDFPMFGVSHHGAYWRRVRKLMSGELLSNRRLELLNDVRVSETAHSVNELYKLWEEKRDESGRVLVDMKQWFRDLNLNVTLRMVVGKRYSGTGADTEESRRYREVMTDFYKHLGRLFVTADAMPYLGWLDF